MGAAPSDRREGDPLPGPPRRARSGESHIPSALGPGPTHPGPAARQALLALQRQVGNRAVGRLLAPDVTLQRVAEDDVPSVLMALASSGASYPRHFDNMSRGEVIACIKAVARKSHGVVPAQMKNHIAGLTVEDAAADLKTYVDSSVENIVTGIGADPVSKGDLKAFLQSSRMVEFSVPGFGEGVVELLTPPQPREDLTWVSHGYERDRSVIAATERRAFGFLVKHHERLLRNQQTGAHAKERLAELKKDPSSYELQGIPHVVVFPHFSDLDNADVEGLMQVAEVSDIAVLRYFRWEVSDPATENIRRYGQTPPLSVMLTGVPALASYKNILIHACRTPWKHGAPVEVKAEGEGRGEALYSWLQ